MFPLAGWKGSDSGRKWRPQKDRPQERHQIGLSQRLVWTRLTKLHSEPQRVTLQVTPRKRRVTWNVGRWAVGPAPPPKCCESLTFTTRGVCGSLSEAPRTSARPAALKTTWRACVHTKTYTRITAHPPTPPPQIGNNQVVFHGRINKRSIRTMGCRSVLKRNENIWGNLKRILLSERGQSEKAARRS